MTGTTETKGAEIADTAASPRASNQRIGEMLVERGLVGAEELASALEVQRRTGQRIGETLVEMGLLSSYDLARVLADRLGLEFAELASSSIDSFLAQRVPEEVARRYRAIPVAHRGDAIALAMADPNDVFAIDDIRVLLNAPLIPMVADPEQLARALERVWPSSDIASSANDAASDRLDTAEEIARLTAVADETPIVRLVNAIIAQAVDERASDVHIEPGATRVRIRLRVDGVLHDAPEAPLSVLRPLISRLKILAGIDIAQTRTPQDGRFSLTANGREVDVRMATLPIADGESAVLRLLDKTGGIMELASLGLDGENLRRYEQAFRAAQGTILASGPTGSGKTSTLYATLLEINSPERNVIAVEDPIEYRVDGIKQVQIDGRAGITFPLALRAILRSDPDVIFVGEIRDLETARIAAEAALTGHLVLSTIHTTRAAAVPLRLMDMGVEPYLVTSALTCVVGQRLVRVLCSHCAEPHTPDRSVRESLELPDELMDLGTIRRAVGCTHCAGTGYQGRMGLYEVMPMTEEICRLVVARGTARDIERWAVAEGMDTMRIAALRRVAEGTLSIDEMLRVVA